MVQYRTYANDTAGNVNSTSVMFTTDTIAPSISIVSPINTTYNNATILTLNLLYLYFIHMAISYSCFINVKFLDYPHLYHKLLNSLM